MPFNRPDISVPATLPTLPAQAAKMSRWTRQAGQKHHGRATPEPYVAGVGRCLSNDCSHSQFLDKDFGVTGWCLDCGTEIYVGLASPDKVPWQVKEGGEVMTNAELSKARHVFHKIWGIGPWAGLKQSTKFGQYVDPEPGAVPPAI